MGGSRSLWGVWMDRFFFFSLQASLARGWMKSFCIPDSRPVLFFFPWPGVLARAVGPWSCLFVERSPSTRESAHISLLSSQRGRASRGQGDQPVVPIRRGRDRTRAHFATIRPERAGLPGRRGKGSRDSFSLFFYGFCVNACGEAPVGDKIELYKCCRVFAFIWIFFCIVFVACT